MKFLTLLLILLSVPSLMGGKKKRRRNRNDHKNDDKYDNKNYDKKNGDPCSCFDINLKYGYPQRIGNEVCYRYSITKDKDQKCRADLDYFILGAYVKYFIFIKQQSMWFKNTRYPCIYYTVYCMH